MGKSRDRLTRGVVVAEAVRILGRDGRDALTARRLAADLGVTPMALYRHVSDMESLIDLALDQILKDLDPPAESTGWTAVRGLFDELRGRLVAHPGVVNVLMDRATFVPNGFVAMDKTLGELSALGLKPKAAVLTFDSLLIFTLGSVRWQLARTGTERGMAARAGTAAPEKLPTLARHARTLGARDADQYFRYGFDRLVAGIQAGL